MGIVAGDDILASDFIDESAGTSDDDKGVKLDAGGYLHHSFLPTLIFGDGADGDVTISSNTTLTSDKFYNNLTINTGIELKPNGYRIFVKGVLTFVGTGKIVSYGSDATNGADGGGNGSTATGGSGAAAANTAGTLPASFASGDGANGMSNGGAETAAGDGVNTAYAVNPTTAAAAGNGGNGYSGHNPAGAAGVNTGTVGNPFTNPMDVIWYRDWTLTDFNQMAIVPSSGGAAGGNQGGAATGGGVSYQTGGAGGGSGSSGGIVFVIARKIVTVNGNDYIDVHGGDGGDGGSSADTSFNSATQGPSGGGSGGAGGHGGVVILVYAQLTGTGTINKSGGTGGTYGTAQIQLGAGPGEVDGAAGTNGSTGVEKVITIYSSDSD